MEQRRLSGSFHRFVVSLQTATDRETSCQVSDPIVEISCPAQLSIAETQFDTTCVLEGNTATCTGNGRAIVDCISRNIFEDITSAGPLQVEMPSPDPFTCTLGDASVGQAISILSLCPPDDTAAQAGTFACNPIESYALDSQGNGFCQRVCTDDCSDQDLVTMTAQVFGLCQWDAEQTPDSKPPTTPPASDPPTFPPVSDPTTTLPVSESPTTPVMTGTLNEDQKLMALDSEDHDNFGSDVAVSGDTAIVGARGDDDESGSAYVFVRSGSTWTQQAKLKATDAEADAEFGAAVAIDGDTVIVGADLNDDSASGPNSGSAYVFVRSGSTWSQEAKLSANDAACYDRFGWSVAVSGDTAIIGAAVDDDGGESSGSAYVFERSGSTWIQQAKLIGSDTTADDKFGNTIAMSGDTVIFGTSREAAYVFVRSGSTWTQQAKLIGGDIVAESGYEGSVALSGDTAIVGAFADIGSDSGSAHVFVRSGSNWTQQAKLTTNGAAVFGGSVAIDGDVAVVGALGDDDFIGSAYLFARSGSTWMQMEKLSARDSTATNYFGGSVAVSGGTVIVGASGTDGDVGADQGSAHVFALDECALGTDNCDVNASCKVTPASFTCACNPGYSGDGVTCTPNAADVPTQMPTTVEPVTGSPSSQPVTASPSVTLSTSTAGGGGPTTPPSVSITSDGTLSSTAIFIGLAPIVVSLALLLNLFD